ncbi:hypothetical protein FRC02_005814 [Tulasnella sp. 418]|nr:hypothetical protein FRC02_005814 [Tulasnella sp. 418]
MNHIPNSVIGAALELLLQYLRSSEVNNVESSAIVGCPTTTFEILEKEIHYLVLSLDAFNGDVRQRLASLRRHRNQLVPINRLPTEILSAILLGTLEETHHEDKMKCTRFMASVSFRWRSIILETSQFWTYINNLSSTVQIEMALERSKQAPLRIYCFQDMTMARRRNEQSFLDMMARFVSRWEYFESDSELTSHLMNDQLEGKSAPMLKRFALYGNGRVTPQNRILSLWNTAPQVQELLIHPFPCPLDPTVLSGLTHLSFAPFIMGSPFTQAQWDVVLENTPNLETLLIQGDVDFGGLHNLAPPGPQIYRPNLREISLRVLHPQVAGMLLSSLLIHPRQVVRSVVGPLNIGRLEEGRLLPESASAGSLLGIVRSYMRSIVGRCRFAIDRFDVSLDAEMVTGNHFVLGCRQIQPPITLFTSLARPDSLSRLTRLTLHGREWFHWIDDTSIILQLKFFTALRALELHVTYEEIPAEDSEMILGNLWTALSTPAVAPGQSEPPWLCSHLTHVTLIGWRYPHTLTMFIHKRYGDMAHSTQPARLEKFTIGGSGATPEIVEQLHPVVSAYGAELLVQMEP